MRTIEKLELVAKVLPMLAEVVKVVGVVERIPVLPQVLSSRSPNNTIPSKELDIVIGIYIAASRSLGMLVKFAVWSK